MTWSLTDYTKRFVNEKINKKTSQSSIYQEDANVAWIGEQYKMEVEAMGYRVEKHRDM